MTFASLTVILFFQAKSYRRLNMIGRGHVRISVVNIESIGFKLTYEEALAIRWHMSCYTKKADLIDGEKREMA